MDERGEWEIIIDENWIHKRNRAKYTLKQIERKSKQE